MNRYEKYKPSGIEWIGEVPEHWDLKKIKFCFDVYAGATPKTENPDNWDGDIVWVTPADYKTEDKFIRGGQRTITKQGYDSCNTQIVPKGSIVFSKRAPIGTIAISDVELCTNQGCLSCVPKGTNSTYYYYVMSVSTECFDLLGSGATFKEISADSFSNVKLPFPSPAEQEAIAAYLDARCGDVDKVVATQEKRIALLNEMKQSIITQAVTRGLNPDAKMKDSGVEWIGMVPEHWVRKPLKFVTNIIMGQSPNGDEIKDEGECLFMQGNAEFGKKYPNAVYYCDNCSKHSRVGDILMSVRAPVGELNYSDQEYGIGRGLCSIKATSIYDGFLWYYLWKSKDDFNSFSNGSTFTAITVETLKGFPIIVPSPAEQEAIAAYLDARCVEIDKQIDAVTRQIELLKEYKQAVITEVVTGKRNVF